MSASELSALLSQSDPLRVLSSVDSLCGSLAGKPYLLSSSFYPSFGLLLHRLLSVSFQGSVAPLVCSAPRAWDLLRPSGSLFALLFVHTAFPPKYALPVSLLPPQCRDFVHSLSSPSSSSSSSSSFPGPAPQSSSASASAGPSPGCPGLVALLRASYQPSSDCLQLSIHDYFFFGLALFLTRDLPAAAKLASPFVAHSAAAGPAGASHPPHFSADECCRGYQSVVQQLLACFLPTAGSSAAGGVGVANRSLHAASLTAILAEVWMGESASAAAAPPHAGSSAHLNGVGGLGSLSTSLPSPFVPALSLSASAQSASPAPAPVAPSPSPASSAGLSFPSLRVLGCVRLLAGHLLSAPSSPPPSAPKLSTSASASAASSNAGSSSAPSAWWLSLSSVDVCLFRFLRSSLLHPPSQYDERFQTVVAVWLAVLSAAAASASAALPPPASAPASASASPAAVCSPSLLYAAFAFCSVLLVDFLHSLPGVDVGREGSPMRAASLKQCVQLMGLLHSSRGDLERVEQLLLFGGLDGLRKGATRAGNNARPQPAALLLRSGVGSRAASQQHEADGVRANYVRLAAQLPDSQYGRVFTVPPQAAQQPTIAQQLVTQAVRYLTPSSVRQGLAPLSLQPAPSASAGRSTAQLLHSSTAFRSQLIAEAQLFDRLAATASQTFQLPSEHPLSNDDDDQTRYSAQEDRKAGAAARGQQTGAAGASANRVSPAVAATDAAVEPSSTAVDRSLSPSRMRSDPYRRLSSTGRQQLARGVALCSKQPASLRFVGGEWDRPVASNECATAVRWLHKLHSAVTDAASSAQHSGQGVGGQQQTQTLQAMLAQLPLRLFARWDVLACGLCAWMAVLVVVALV